MIAIPANVPSPLALEHALIMVMLLYVMLSQARTAFWLVIAFVLAGSALSLFTPTHSLQPSWELLHRLLLPFIIWESAIQIAQAARTLTRSGLMAFSLLAALLVLAFTFIGGLPFSNSLLLAALTASLVWRFRPDFSTAAFFAGAGIITLAILLVEVDLLALGSRSFIRLAISGIALGFVNAALYVAALRFTRRRNFGGLGIYLVLFAAFWVGELFGTSSIGVMFTTALFIAVYGYSSGLWRQVSDMPVFFKKNWSLVILGLVWLLLGWEAHVVLTAGLVLSLVAGLAMIPLGLWLVTRLLPSLTAAPHPQASTILTVQQYLASLMLIAGLLFLWPPELVLDTTQVEIALLTALIMVGVLRLLLPVLFEMLHISLRWPDETDHIA